MAATNNEAFSSLGTPTGSLTDITDGTDAVHTGIVKALNRMATGSVALDGFNVTGISATTITFGNGKILRDGVLSAITGTTVTIGVSDRVANAYHLIVVAGSTLAYRVGQANIVANPNDDDVIIGMVKWIDGSTNMQFQYLTGQKTTNGISIAYDNSGTYTEAGKLTGDNNGITMTGLYKLDTLPTATVATDDKVILQDTNDSDIIKTVTAQAIADLKVIPTATNIADADGDTKIQVEESADEDKIRFDTGGTERAIIDSTGLGIGTSAPDAALHVRGSSNPTVRIQEDSQTGYLDLSGLQDSQASITAQNDTASEVSILDITAKCNSSTGTGQEVRIFRNARSNTDGTFVIKQPGTNTNVMVLSSDSAGSAHTMYHNGTLAVNKSSAASGVTLEVNGDVGGDRFLVESVQYEIALVTSAGAVPGPPSNNFSFADTDTIYRVSTVTGTPPGSAQLDGALPTTTNNEGLVFKFIVTAIASGEALTITANGSDTIVDQTLAVLAGAGGTYSIPSAGVYELVCFSGSWMLYKTV